jgi:DNA ligase-1
MLAVPESRGEPDNPVAQSKVDGYRVLLHISEDSVKAFSRRNNEVTESLPELEEIDFPAGEYILDAEVVSENGSYSETSSRIGRDAENVERDVEMHFAVFDALVYAGEHIWEEPYAKRYTRLESFDLNTDDRVFVLGVSTDIEQAKNQVMMANDEGIIVKDWQAPYEFGKRSTYWQKVKVDADSLDLKIVGFVEGDGKASGTLGKVELETSDGTYVGDSGSGFSDEERAEIWDNQDEYYGEVIEVEGRGIGSQGKIRMPIFKNHRPEGEADSWEKVQEVMKNI